MLEHISKLIVRIFGSKESKGSGSGPKYLFCILLILGLTISIMAILLTGGESLSSVLFYDRYDQFMDYFNSIYYSRSGPYINFNVIYPGLITVFYSVMGALLEVVGVDTGLRWGIRSSSAGLASYVIITIALLALLFYVLLRNKKSSKKEIILIFVLILTSYPMIYCLDRGNSMLMSVIFSLLFFIFFKSEKKEHRYLSFFFLSLAIAIKIYPAFFGILILKEALKNKDYKELILCITMCVIVFIVPFFFTDGTVLDLFRNATEHSEELWAIGHVSLVGILESTAYWLYGIQLGTGASSIWISLILFAIGAIVVLADKTAPYWETVSLLVCIQILSVGVAPPYVLLYMIIPMWYFLIEDSSEENKTYLVSFLLAIILIMVPGFWIVDANSVSYGKAISVLILTIVLIHNASKRLLTPNKNV